MRNGTWRSMAPADSDVFRRCVIHWFKYTYIRLNCSKAIFCGNETTSLYAPLIIMQLDKAFDSWLDENYLFYDWCVPEQFWHNARVCEDGEKGRGKRVQKQIKWVSSGTTDFSRLVLHWPEPHFLQPDDWFLFGAIPMGLIKSTCKLTPKTNCRENASSQHPVRGGPGLLLMS